jgi:mitochondrial fission protein ELM1
MTSPRIWVLLDDRPGHQTQVLGLAERLGMGYETRSLTFNGFSRIHNGILGARDLSLDKSGSDDLSPPYPDLLIAMGRRCVPIARWIRRASGQKTRLVHLGRKGLVAPREFALLISCAHFQLPPHPQRMVVPLPPTKVTARRLAAARTEWEGLRKNTQEPYVVLLVGGETAHHCFTPSQAAEMLRRAEAAVQTLGGTLTVVTSRRTSAAAIAAMREAATQAAFHLWKPDEVKNPYLGYLAWADVLIVTGESESMLAEAAATGKPLYIAPLQPKPLSKKRKVTRWITSVAAGRGQVAAIARRLLNSGWITPYRDLEKMHTVMYRDHLARPFETSLSLQPPEQSNALDEISERLHHLLDSNGSGS